MSSKFACELVGLPMTCIYAHIYKFNKCSGSPEPVLPCTAFNLKTG